MEMTFLW